MGFGRRWRAWIIECIRSASISVMVNGAPSKPFKMERGLRQGDLLSPFLFILVVDVLNRMIGEAVRNRRIAPLLVGRDNVELSHLQFDDDTILFCPLEEETVRNYKRLLRCFEVMSGLSINFDKSSLIPVNCSQEWASQMCRLLGCQAANLPVKYLEINLGANPRLVKTWKPLIDKVEEKLSLWKAKVLSKARKLVLIKFVINSLPTYYLSLYKMPVTVAKKISLQRRFFWGKDDGQPGLALVKWEMIQASKKLGGLGVGDVMIRNTVQTLTDDVLNYKFTNGIWKGIVPPRIELFTLFRVVQKVTHVVDGYAEDNIGVAELYFLFLYIEGEKFEVKWMERRKRTGRGATGGCCHISSDALQ
ncbi:uncharacterized protein LOC107607841 [Arachis ipaensis]|uniref:uncharacterized protein LOC107607841 n=1 Tax=Arachis ipaensis TaxID=130454 RepID=UPI0007AF95D7|nr:uncharacterized protein LOC107607841 [Arachis ipaensis]